MPVLGLALCGGLVLAAFAVGWALGVSRLRGVAHPALVLLLAATALAPAAVAPCALAGFALVLLLCTPLEAAEARA